MLFSLAASNLLAPVSVVSLDPVTFVEFETFDSLAFANPNVVLFSLSSWVIQIYLCLFTLGSKTKAADHRVSNGVSGI